jgi:hypothetical protein|tara:strand:- start:131 stop:316 length:186 start_codon:yes stop_codon:yes gene_type:complete
MYKIIIAFVGLFILFNHQTNPFVEYKYINGEEELTNSSYVMILIILAIYGYLINLWISDKE